jgi:TonB family protein
MRAVLVAAVTLPGVSAAQGQTPGDLLKSLVDQKFLLLHVADRQEAKLKKEKLGRVSGTCDVAVNVQEASWNSGTARFRFEVIGTPNLPGKPAGQCKMVYSSTTLEISGFARDEQPDSVSASIGQLLQTPEQYMAGHGISFDPTSGQDDASPVKTTGGFSPPRALLSVDPTFSEQARRSKYQGNLSVRVTIGTDGRIQKSQVVNKLGMGLDEMALKVLPMWRFQPPTQSGKPVASEVTIEMSFNLY